MAVDRDATAYSNCRVLTVNHDCAYGHAKVGHTRVSQIADGTRIYASAATLFFALEFVDYLNSSCLWCSGHRATRKRSRQRIDAVKTRSQLALDRTHQLVHGGIALDIEKFGYLNRVNLCHPADVVAHQIDNHEVFCSLFLVFCELLRESAVNNRVGVSASGSLNRFRRNRAVRIDLQELLG